MHPAFTAIVAALWFWAPCLHLQATPLHQVIGGATTPASGPASPGTAAILGWWNLDNNGNDASANARNMSAQGSVSYTTAKIGTHSFLIDATNEWLFISDAAWMTPAGSFSICGWHRPTDATPTFNVGLFSHWGAVAATSRSYYVRLNSASTVTFSIASGDGTTTKSVTSTTTAADNTWFFYAAVFEASSSMKIYINGSLNGTNTDTIPAAVRNNTGTGTDGQLRIGSYNTESTNSALGRHDSVGFFNKALTAGEITWLYNSGNGRAYSDL